MDTVELERLKQSNLDRLQALANQGIRLNVGDLAFLKMEAVIDMLLSDDQKVELEETIEQKKKEILDQIFSEIRKQQLVQGVKPSARDLLIPR